jgi:hypothetical protein
MRLVKNTKRLVRGPGKIPWRVLGLGKMLESIKGEEWVQTHCLDPHMLSSRWASKPKRVLGCMPRTLVGQYVHSGVGHTPNT